MPSLKVDVSDIKALARKFTDKGLIHEIEMIPEQKAVQAIVAQAIGDNFDQQGPGWKPLKSQTIRQSVGKKRMKQKQTKSEPHRMILQKTGVLKKSVTTPGARGNISRVEGKNLVWGTDLVYAAIHNSGGVIRHPGTANGFGAGIKIPGHSIPIPKREFLVIREKWKIELYGFMFDRVISILASYIRRKT